MHLFGRCGQVSRSWSEIIQQDKRARLKRRFHLREVEAAIQVRPATLSTTATSDWPVTRSQFTVDKNGQLWSLQPCVETCFGTLCCTFTQIQQQLSRDGAPGSSVFVLLSSSSAEPSMSPTQRPGSRCSRGRPSRLFRPSRGPPVIAPRSHKGAL